MEEHKGYDINKILEKTSTVHLENSPTKAYNDDTTDYNAAVVKTFKHYRWI